MPGEPWEIGQRGEFRSRFGEDVDAYDRTRPVPPAEVFDDVVELAGLAPGSTVVEIGPGTGQATRGLAMRGLRVLALEIDARLAARATRNLTGLPQATVRTTSFEAWERPDERFDAVFACNSFHWIEPAVRFRKAAAVLGPHGHLVVVSTPVVVPTGADRFWWDVQDDWAAVGAGRVDPATKHPDLVEDWVTAVNDSQLFGECRVSRRPFTVELSAEDYAANLSTQSGVKQLPARARAQLVSRVLRRVEAQGGTLIVHHLAVVTVATRITAAAERAADCS